MVRYSRDFKHRRDASPPPHVLVFYYYVGGCGLPNLGGEIPPLEQHLLLQVSLTRTAADTPKGLKFCLKRARLHAYASCACLLRHQDGHGTRT